jgi:hypothetical protein
MESGVPKLPPAECEMGYPADQLRRMYGEQGYRRLMLWMDGQTMTLCEGRSYDYSRNRYVQACGGVSHGLVVYGHDVQRWLAALPVID